MIDKKNSNDLIKKLGILGLSAKEAEVYLSLLALGQVGSSKIITATGLHGQFVYQAIETLEAKGLMQHVIMNGRKKFSAKSPETILTLIEEQKRIANGVIADIKKQLIVAPDQAFEVFQGEESWRAHEFSLLDHAEKGSILLVIGGEGDHFSRLMGEADLRTYENIRYKKNITVKYIGCESQRVELQKQKTNRRLFSYKILLGLFTGIVNTNIWEDAVNINMFGSPVTSAEMNNSQVAESYRGFFETLWKMGK